MPPSTLIVCVKRKLVNKRFENKYAICSYTTWINLVQSVWVEFIKVFQVVLIYHLSSYMYSICVTKKNLQQITSYDYLTMVDDVHKQK